MNALLSPLRAWWVFVCFFVWPDRFVEHATRDCVSREFRTNKQLQQAFPDGQLPDDRIAAFRRARQEQTEALRRSVLLSLMIVAVLCLAGWATSAQVRDVPSTSIAGLRVLSAGFVLWAVLGRLGFKIQTYKGTTLPEQVNDVWFRVTYGLGTYLLMLSLMLRTGGTP